MPRHTDLQSILILGSGPIVSGQAARFGRSGTRGRLRSIPTRGSYFSQTMWTTDGRATYSSQKPSPYLCSEPGGIR